MSGGLTFQLPVWYTKNRNRTYQGDTGHPAEIPLVLRSLSRER